MKSGDFRKRRLVLELSQVNLGKLMGVSGHTVLRWELGQVPIPKLAELALELIEQKQSKRPR
jgi:DNA-binding transcriptional regulator YiaG